MAKPKRRTGANCLLVKTKPLRWTILGTLDPGDFFRARKHSVALLLTIVCPIQSSEIKRQIELNQVIIKKKETPGGGQSGLLVTEEWPFSALVYSNGYSLGRVKGRLYFDQGRLRGEIFVTIPLPPSSPNVREVIIIEPWIKSSAHWLTIFYIQKRLCTQNIDTDSVGAIIPSKEVLLKKREPPQSQSDFLMTPPPTWRIIKPSLSLLRLSLKTGIIINIPVKSQRGHLVNVASLQITELIYSKKQRLWRFHTQIFTNGGAISGMPNGIIKYRRRRWIGTITTYIYEQKTAGH